MAEKVDLLELIEHLGEVQKHAGHAALHADGALAGMRDARDSEEEPDRDDFRKRLTAARDRYEAACDACDEALEKLGGRWGGASALDQERMTSEEKEAAYTRDGKRRAADALPASLQGLALDGRTRRAVARAIGAQAVRQHEAAAAVDDFLGAARQAHPYRNHG